MQRQRSVQRQILRCHACTHGPVGAYVVDHVNPRFKQLAFERLLRCDRHEQTARAFSRLWLTVVFQIERGGLCARVAGELNINDVRRRVCAVQRAQHDQCHL
ncbi:hypothetical protein BED46_027380 [Burkholderia contaminans]|nr:hypothetical protein BED46_025395 [Burkholderia contaminans]OMI79677.1 hypothetical protein BED46_027380 [Burkholderia contaminans]